MNSLKAGIAHWQSRKIFQGVAAEAAWGWKKNGGKWRTSGAEKRPNAENNMQSATHHVGPMPASTPELRLPGQRFLKHV